MGELVYPIVPVAIHEVLVDAASGLVQTGIEIIDLVRTLNGQVGDIENLITVGRDLEAFETSFNSGQHFL